MPETPLILLIESSSLNCSVAVAKGKQLVGIKEEANNGFVHAENLHLFAEIALSNSNHIWNDLSAVAIGVGPGSYTGLRIGVSFAKGLCLALNIPLLAISSLEGLFWHFLETHNHLEHRVYWPMVDARRMEVYTAGYDENGEALYPRSAMMLTERLPPQPGICFGDGAGKAKEILEAAHFVVFDGPLPTAKGLINPALEAFHKQHFVNLDTYEPDYLKEFVAGKKKLRTTS